MVRTPESCIEASLSSVARPKLLSDKLPVVKARPRPPSSMRRRVVYVDMPTMFWPLTCVPPATLRKLVEVRRVIPSVSVTESTEASTLRVTVSLEALMWGPINTSSATPGRPTGDQLPAAFQGPLATAHDFTAALATLPPFQTTRNNVAAKLGMTNREPWRRTGPINEKTLIS